MIKYLIVSVACVEVVILVLSAALKSLCGSRSVALFSSSFPEV